jgi:hypothetical protein
MERSFESFLDCILLNYKLTIAQALILCQTHGHMIMCPCRRVEIPEIKEHLLRGLPQLSPCREREDGERAQSWQFQLLVDCHR